jgi:hypothetical protein
MVNKGTEQVGTLVCGQQRVGDGVRESLPILRDTVGQCAIRGMPPALLDDVALRRRGREERHEEARAIERAEQPRRFLLPTEALPDHAQGRLRGPWSCGTQREPSWPVTFDAVMAQEKPRRCGPGETVRALVTERRSWRSQLAWRGVVPRGAQGRRTVGGSMKPVWAIKTVVRSSCRALCAPGPLWRWPLCQSLRVAFTGTAGRFVWAPLAPAQQAPDARGTIGDAARLLDQRRDPCEGPGLVGIAMRTRPLTQQGQEGVPGGQGEGRDTAGGGAWH